MFYDWLPWDLGAFRHSNIYIRVVQRKLGGDLLISIESSYAHEIQEKHGDFNKYSYQRPRMVWDTGVCALLETSNLWAVRICNVPNFNKIF